MTRAAWWSDFDPWHGGRVPSLRLCSYAARGLWASLLTIMEDSEAPGFLLIHGRVPTIKQLACLFAGTGRKSVATMIRELESARVFRRTGAVDLSPELRTIVPAGMRDGVIFEPRLARAVFEYGLKSVAGSSGAARSGPANQGTSKSQHAWARRSGRARVGKRSVPSRKGAATAKIPGTED